MPAFEEGSALKAQGNAAFQAGRLEDAIVLYDRAVAVLHSPDAHKGGGGGVSDDERRIITQKLACDVLNNKAMCLLKLARHDDVVTVCSRVLTEDPRAIKAFFRRALANEALGKP